MKQTEEEPTVTRYWLTFYTTSGLCDLCANTGVVTTRDRDHRIGKTYCFCPNGQQMRIEGTKI